MPEEEQYRTLLRYSFGMSLLWNFRMCEDWPMVEMTKSVMSHLVSFI